MTERRVVIGGHEPARDARAIRWLAATLLGTTLLAAPQAADAACSPSTLCPGTGDCTITGTNTVDNACFLDFGTRRVTVHNTAKLKTSTTGHSYTVSAGQLTVRGTLEAYGGILVVRAVGGGTSNGSVATEKVSNSPGKIDVRDGGIATVIAAGDVSITGQDVNADGGSPRINGGAITLRGTNVTVTGPMHADGALGGDGGDIRIEAHRRRHRERHARRRGQRRPIGFRVRRRWTHRHPRRRRCARLERRARARRSRRRRRPRPHPRPSTSWR